MSKIIRLFLLGLLIALAASAAHADNWRQRAKDTAAASAPEHQPCVLYVDLADNRLHIRAPVCFYVNVYSTSYDGYLSFNGRKAGATHPAIPCAETIEGVERVDPTTFLVRLYCPTAVPQRDAVSVQLIDDTIHIFNVETN
jgi:hypothetical protein